MNVVMNGGLYRNLQKRFNWHAWTWGTLIVGSIVTAVLFSIFVFIPSFVFLILWLPIGMTVIPEVSDGEKDINRAYRYDACLYPKSNPEGIIISHLETLLVEHRTELKMMCDPDSLFMETWDQIELNQIELDRQIMDAYCNKLINLVDQCVSMSKQLALSGKERASDVLDSALKVAKEFK